MHGWNELSYLATDCGENSKIEFSKERVVKVMNGEVII